MTDEAVKLFTIAIVAGFLSQGLKICYLLFVKKQSFDIRDLVITGSMPSSHSALVTALALGVLWLEGFTTLFLVAGVMAVIVIRDALGVRRTAGEEGKLINEIIKKTNLKLKPLHYSLGHTPAEVAAGIFIGALSSFVAFL